MALSVSTMPLPHPLHPTPPPSSVPRRSTWLFCILSHSKPLFRKPVVCVSVRIICPWYFITALSAEVYQFILYFIDFIRIVVYVQLKKNAHARMHTHSLSLSLSLSVSLCLSVSVSLSLSLSLSSNNETDTERWERESKLGRLFLNSKTLFDEDCSFDSMKNLTTREREGRESVV